MDWFDIFEEVVVGRYRGGACVYALIDPRTDEVFYVGVSGYPDRRLYAHTHSTKSGKRTPCVARTAAIRAAGVAPRMAVLQRLDGYKKQSVEVLAAEWTWIEAFHLMGAAVCNIQQTPVGHANSKNSAGKKMRAELMAAQKTINALLRENERLVAENYALRGSYLLGGGKGVLGGVDASVCH